MSSVPWGSSGFCFPIRLSRLLGESKHIALPRRSRGTGYDGRIRDLLHTKNPESAWLETRHPLSHAVGRKRSLFFEFIALQRKVRFTDNPFCEKVGTGSVIGPQSLNAISFFLE